MFNIRSCYPKTRKGFVILICLSLIQVTSFLLFTVLYDVHDSIDDVYKILKINTNFQQNEDSNFIPKLNKTSAYIDSEDPIKKQVNKQIKSIMSSKDYNSNWKYFTKLHYYESSINPKYYIRDRKKYHSYDPRITLAVYLHHIAKLFKEKNPKNDNFIELQVPFSWQDWVDLSALNEYLQYDESEKPTCQDILEKGIEYSPSKSIPNPNHDYKLEICYDNRNYVGATDKNLLPGFNFLKKPDDNTFPEEKIQAKSYLLSTQPLPNSLVFLTNDGSYEVFPKDEATMMNSGLFLEYAKDKKNKNYSKQMKFNPIAEFNELKKNVPSRHGEIDFKEALTESNRFSYNVPPSSFRYDPGKLMENLLKKEKMTSKEKRHILTLQNSLQLDENNAPKTFTEANVKKGHEYNGHKVIENGAHYDFRFFNGFISESKINLYDNIIDKRKIILHQMLHTWLQFTYTHGITTFPAHGSMLSWYWNSLSFDWDEDIDVIMPIMDLNDFCMNYNGSIIVQDVEFGFGKYFVHCSSSITIRHRGNGANAIDARFIDVDSGMYIDITGLAVSKSDALTDNQREKYGLPKKNDDESWYDYNEKHSIYNCRNNHFYRQEELSPLRLTTMEHAPSLMPIKIEQILTQEYVKEAIFNISYNDFVFIKKLRLWITMSDLMKAARKAGAPTNMRGNDLIAYYLENEEKTVEKLIEDDDENPELCLTWGQTGLHQVEVELFEKLQKNEYDDEVLFTWNKIMNGYKNYHPPMRKVLFDYIQEVEMLKFGLNMNFKDDRYIDDYNLLHFLKSESK